MKSIEFAVVDVETTGFSRRNDRIVEIAIIRINQMGEITRQYETLINPLRDVGASGIHKITATDLIEAPTFQEVKSSILNMINNAVVVSHNKSFDLGFLQSEFSRVGIDLSNLDGICTLRLSKVLFPELPSRKLEVLCDYLDVLVENAHRAYDDCLATALLFHKMSQTLIKDITEDIFYDELVVPNLFHIDIDELDSLIEYKREDAELQLETEQYKMRSLFNRIPDYNHPLEYYISEYLNLLDEILEDRVITDEELKAIEEYAIENRINSDKLSKIHEEYYRRLVRYYLSDNFLSDSELIDLEKVANLLQIENEASRTIINLEKAELDLEFYSKQEKNKFEGMSVCFSGQFSSKLNGQLIDKEIAHQLAIEKGLIVKKGVSKKLDLLVVADSNSQSSKARKAREYNIRILTDMVFWRKIGLNID